MSIQDRFQNAVKKRGLLKAQAQRLQGTLDASRQQLKEVTEECKAKGLTPDQLEGAIERLKEKYTTGVVGFEAEVDEAGEQLAPYLGDI